ncbi:MAG: HAMP domain-containing protein, partial [Acidobacteriota bacterium]
MATLVIVAVSVFYLAYFPRRLERNLVRNIGGIIETTTAVASVGLAAELKAGDRAGLEMVLKENCRQASGIRYAVLEDGSGLVLASANRDVAEENMYREPDPARPTLERRAMYRTKTPVMADGKALGTLFLGFSFDGLITGTTREKSLIVIVCLTAIFVSGLLASLFSGMITRPVVQVTRTAEKVLKGDATQRAKVYSRDEMGLLARTFNAMLDGFEKSRRDMETANRSLEEAAHARSEEIEKEIVERRRIEKELRLAQEELEHRVEKRTAELSKVNEELSGKVIETRRSEDQLQSTLERLEKALEGTVRAMSLTVELR